MKNLLMIIILLSLSVTVKAAGAWGELASDDGPSQQQQQQDQDQLIGAELDDEVQSASGLKMIDDHPAAKAEVNEKPVTEETAVADLGKEMDDADAKVHQLEVEAQKTAKVEKAELKKKQKLQKQLKAVKASKKTKILSSKNKAPKYVYGGAKGRQVWAISL